MAARPTRNPVYLTLLDRSISPPTLVKQFCSDDGPKELGRAAKSDPAAHDPTSGKFRSNDTRVMSSTHARITWDERNYAFIEDLDSTNGTTVGRDGEPSHLLTPGASYRLFDGDVLTFGRQVNERRSGQPICRPVVVVAGISDHSALPPTPANAQASLFDHNYPNMPRCRSGTLDQEEASRGTSTSKYNVDADDLPVLAEEDELEEHSTMQLPASRQKSDSSIKRGFGLSEEDLLASASQDEYDESDVMSLSLDIPVSDASHEAFTKSERSWKAADDDINKDDEQMSTVSHQAAIRTSDACSLAGDNPTTIKPTSSEAEPLELTNAEDGQEFGGIRDSTSGWREFIKEASPEDQRTAFDARSPFGSPELVESMPLSVINATDEFSPTPPPALARLPSPVSPNELPAARAQAITSKPIHKRLVDQLKPRNKPLRRLFPDSDDSASDDEMAANKLAAAIALISSPEARNKPHMPALVAQAVDKDEDSSNEDAAPTKKKLDAPADFFSPPVGRPMPFTPSRFNQDLAKDDNDDDIDSQASHLPSPQLSAGSNSDFDHVPQELAAVDGNDWSVSLGSYSEEGVAIEMPRAAGKVASPEQEQRLKSATPVPVSPILYFEFAFSNEEKGPKDWLDFARPVCSEDSEDDEQVAPVAKKTDPVSPAAKRVQAFLEEQIDEECFIRAAEQGAKLLESDEENPVAAEEPQHVSPPSSPFKAVHQYHVREYTKELEHDEVLVKAAEEMPVASEVEKSKTNEEEGISSDGEAASDIAFEVDEEELDLDAVEVDFDEVDEDEEELDLDEVDLDFDEMDTDEEVDSDGASWTEDPSLGDGALDRPWLEIHEALVDEVVRIGAEMDQFARRNGAEEVEKVMSEGSVVDDSVDENKASELSVVDKYFGQRNAQGIHEPREKVFSNAYASSSGSAEIAPSSPSRKRRLSETDLEQDDQELKLTPHKVNVETPPTTVEVIPIPAPALGSKRRRLNLHIKTFAVGFLTGMIGAVAGLGAIGAAMEE
ncbi:hypothetical protein JCM21900_002903 [Sporobolomyces salmonicolor]